MRARRIYYSGFREGCLSVVTGDCPSISTSSSLFQTAQLAALCYTQTRNVAEPGYVRESTFGELPDAALGLGDIIAVDFPCPSHL